MVVCFPCGEKTTLFCWASSLKRWKEWKKGINSAVKGFTGSSEGPESLKRAIVKGSLRDPSRSVCRGGVPQGTIRGPLIVWCKRGNEGMKGMFLGFLIFHSLSRLYVCNHTGKRDWCSMILFEIYFYSLYNLNELTRCCLSKKVHLSFWIWCNTFDKMFPFL